METKNVCTNQSTQSNKKSLPLRFGGYSVFATTAKLWDRRYAVAVRSVTKTLDILKMVLRYVYVMDVVFADGHCIELEVAVTDRDKDLLKKWIETGEDHE